MNQKINNILILALGVVTGTLATQQYFKRKYEKIAKEEIASVKEMRSNREPRVTGYESTEEAPPPETEKIKVKDRPKTEKKNYGDYFPKFEKPEITTEEVKRPVEKPSDKPYVISPDLYGEDETFDRITLTYYEGDKILTDDDDVRIKDVDGAVGIYSLNTFGDYEKDTVFVKNDREKTYYEICLDTRAYAEVIGEKTNMDDDD